MRKHLLSRRGAALVQLAGLAALAAGLAGLSFSHFDHARQRAKLAETYRSLDRIAAAMESYMIDNGGYPASDAVSPLPGHGTYAQADNRLLTTPTAYLDRTLDDPFRISTNKRLWIYVMGLHSTGPSINVYPHTIWMTWSNGPDRITQTGSYRSLATIIANESKPWPEIGGADSAVARRRWADLQRHALRSDQWPDERGGHLSSHRTTAVKLPSA